MTDQVATPEVKTYDIHNTKEMLTFLFQLAEIVKEAKTNDGKINVMDAYLLMKLVPTLGPAFGDINDIPNELKDLSQAEIDELVAYISKSTGELVGNAKLVEQITAGLEVVKAISKFVVTLKKD